MKEEKLEEVEAHAIYYWECPKCDEDETEGICDGDFDSSGVAPNGGTKWTHETECECGHVFVVVKP